MARKRKRAPEGASHTDWMLRESLPVTAQRRRRVAVVIVPEPVPGPPAIDDTLPAEGLPPLVFQEVTLGDTKEGTMAVRLAETMRVTQPKGKKGDGPEPRCEENPSTGVPGLRVQVTPRS